MIALLTRLLCRSTPTPAAGSLAPATQFVPLVPSEPPESANPAAAEAMTASPALPTEASACGWFDSSLDLRQGLAVSEVRDPDWTVLVLWFGPAALRGPALLQRGVAL